MKYGLYILTTVGILAMLVVAPLLGHQELKAKFDTSKTTTIKGVVTKIEWTSPHVFVYFASAENGESVDWSMELDPPVLLRRYGWSKETVSVGDTITCTGAPARSGAKTMRGAIVELKDGTQLRVWSRV